KTKRNGSEKQEKDGERRKGRTERMTSPRGLARPSSLGGNPASGYIERKPASPLPGGVPMRRCLLPWGLTVVGGFALVCALTAPPGADSQQKPYDPKIFGPSGEGEKAIKRIK